MAMEDSRKRRTYVNGTDDGARRVGLPFMQVAEFNAERMSDSQKLSYLCSKMAIVESLSTKMNSMDVKLNGACNQISEVKNQISVMEQDAKRRVQTNILGG